MNARQRLHAPCALATLAAFTSLAVPAAAQAGGFGAPQMISGRDDVSYPTVVMTPTGRTAVRYTRRTEVRGRDRYSMRVALGPSPSQLGRPGPLRLPAGALPAARLEGASLFPRPDGGFLLCTVQGRTQGCSVAPGAGGFGPLIPLPGKPAGLSAVVRPDGTAVLLRSTQTERNGTVTNRRTSVTILSADGRPGPERPLVRSEEELSYNPNSPELAVAGDGTVAIAANLHAQGTQYDTQLGIRVLPPGGDTFGPRLVVPGKPLDNNISLLSGPRITIAYGADRLEGSSDDFDTRALQLLPDGTFGPTLALPGSDARDVSGTVLPLPDGQLFAVTSRTATADGDQDCLNPVLGVIGSGVLAPLGTANPSTQLSVPGQIAWHEQAVALADGTLIAAWHDGINAAGDRRVDTAVRTPGAANFSPSRRMPRILWYEEPVLAGGGNQATLAWLVEGKGNRTSLVVSAYRTTAPYAKFVPLPKHPETSCDE